MKKTNFLLSSFIKALNKPKTALFKDYVLCCRNSESGYIFTDRSNCDFSPYFLKNSEIHELSEAFKHDLSHNAQLREESDLFNHYFAENIVIPDDFPKAELIRSKLGLTALSRQAAQIKCLLATIIPADFQTNCEKLMPEYQNIMAKVRKFLADSPDADSLIKIMDFSFYYKKITREVNFLDLFFFNNKKIFKNRLTEIIENLINKQAVSTDFADSNIFIKPFFLFGNQGRRYHAFYTESLLFLSGKILSMRNNPELLKLALLQVNDDKAFQSELRYFRNAHLPPDFHDILKIKRSAQKLYEQFAKICYLNAVRASLEIFYAHDNPLPQNQPLPSVAPAEELKNIKNIIERCKSIIIKKGHMAKQCHKILYHYGETCEELNRAISDYKALI